MTDLPPTQLPQQPQQPLSGAQDPRSQYLAAAIQALQHQGGGIQSVGQLGSSLLQQMLLQKAYQNQGAPQANSMQGTGAPPGGVGGAAPQTGLPIAPAPQLSVPGGMAGLQQYLNGPRQQLDSNLAPAPTMQQPQGQDPLAALFQMFQGGGGGGGGG